MGKPRKASGYLNYWNRGEFRLLFHHSLQGPYLRSGQNLKSQRASHSSWQTGARESNQILQPRVYLRGRARWQRSDPIRVQIPIDGKFMVCPDQKLCQSRRRNPHDPGYQTILVAGVEQSCETVHGEKQLIRRTKVQRSGFPAGMVHESKPVSPDLPTLGGSICGKRLHLISLTNK